MQASDQHLISGWLLIDKPQGLTSAAVVGTLRRHWQQNLIKSQQQLLKIGHGGTLDPFATGLLPIALGEATKTVAYIMNGKKRYRFQIHWGEATDTQDREGRLISTNSYRPKKEEVLAALPQFTGEIYQTPPAYSAIKVNGKRSCDLARKGQAPLLPRRLVHVYSLKLVDTPDDHHAVFDVVCGKGTYIRTLAQSIATTLQTCGHVCQLRRLTVHPFANMASLTLKQALSLTANDWQVSESFYPLEHVLKSALPTLQLDARQALRLRNGLGVPLALALNHDVSVDNPFAHGYNSPLHSSGKDFTVWSRGQAIVLARLEQGVIKSKRAFNHRKKPLFMKGTV